MSRETAEHAYEKSNHAFYDGLCCYGPGLRRHFKKITRRGRRRAARKELAS